MDKYSDFRKTFNTNFRKISKSEVEKLSPGQQKIYEEIVSNQNIAAVPKDKSANDFINDRVRLREFDSETFKPVKTSTLLGGRGAKKIRQDRRAKANEYKTDARSSSKGYDTRSGVRTPKPRPKIAPKEKRAKSFLGSK